jgi:ABC-type multidrug transport system ATPase subunit
MINISINNIGAVKHAELSLGDLTIICGGNNTGKTYVTYTLYGFLEQLENLIELELKTDYVDELISKGEVLIELKPYIENINNTLKKACEEYSKNLAKIFASSPELFKESTFSLSVDDSYTDILNRVNSIEFERHIKTPNKDNIFTVSKKINDTAIKVTFIVSGESPKISKDTIKTIIISSIEDIVFKKLLPTPFIATAERTGATIFRDDLNLSRNRLLDSINNIKDNFSLFEQLFKQNYSDYALPIKENLNFIRNLKNISKQSSFLKSEHADILEDFEAIIDGKYIVDDKNELLYKPNKKNLKLNMGESSSSIRALLDIGFYLHHIAKPGDLLMIDEPELNLHPENQRKLARIFSKLTKVGIKVFITTHSDYIIKELNTLIMLNNANHGDERLKKIVEREKIHLNALLAHDRVKVYIAEKVEIKVEQNTRRNIENTLTIATITPENGIEARSFDITINDMNRIQDDIYWGK